MPTGRPPHQPTDESRNRVKTLVMAGVNEETIAVVLEIAPKTLRKHYRRELDTTKPLAIGQVAQSLFSKAVSKDHPQATTAAIFYLKTQGRWREVQQHEHTGKDGAPIPVEDAGFAALAKDLDPDERAQLRAILSRRLNRRSEDT